jgi:hypothetical protein
MGKMKKALIWIEENKLQKDPKALNKYIKYINTKNNGNILSK